MFDFRALNVMLAGKDVADVACPYCGPGRHALRNQTRRVLRLWFRPGFISFHCTRCGAHGFVLEEGRETVDREMWQRQRVDIAARKTEAAALQLDKARWLWKMRRSVCGTPAERYLREVRHVTCALQPTVGFLQARGNHPPALIAAFGAAIEHQAGVLSLAENDVRGVHLTRLRPDGSGKAENPSKIMIGQSTGWPIVLSPTNDLLGLAIGEGVEDVLSAYQCSGLGAWAAGCASRLPALADVVPAWINCVTIIVDPDDAGRKYAVGLAERLCRRGIHAELSEGPV